MRNHRVDARQSQSFFRVAGRPATGDDGASERTIGNRGSTGCTSGALRTEDVQTNRLPNGLTTLTGSLNSHAASVHDPQVSAFRLVHLAQARRAKQRSDLLAFILIDLAAQCGDAKSLHDLTTTE